MKFQLKSDTEHKGGVIAQILQNRGIPYNKVDEYLTLTDSAINDFLLFGKKNLQMALNAILICIQNEDKAAIVVDSDCDGYTSAALFLNYFYLYVPSWITNCIQIIHHNGKEHGLQDCMDKIDKDVKLVICPDSSSNDYEQHKILKDKGITCVIFDHHEADKISPDAIVINNQLCDYPNKDLSGVGVVWQFCRYVDSLLKTNNADNFYDLVALGLDGDMMDMTSFETAYIIREGIKPERLKNPFIIEMSEKNAYSLGETPTPVGWSWYIVPFVNSMVRSGTAEEKALLFNSMLDYKGNTLVRCTKRGCHDPMATETIAEQAVRVAASVKNRQTKAEKEGMEILEKLIKERNLLDNKVLLFLLSPGMIERNIAGLAANRIMGKYQRPTCVLIKSTQELAPWESEKETKTVYSGSARGCDLSGAVNFKDVCEASGVTNYQQGHQSAFGLSIDEENIEPFLECTNAAYADVSDEMIYQVDFIYDEDNISPTEILDIGEQSHLWGNGFPEPYVVLKDFVITNDMVKIYEKRTFTLNINIGSNLSVIKFNATPEIIKDFTIAKGKSKKVTFIGYCSVNSYLGRTSPQIKLVDYEISDSFWDF